MPRTSSKQPEILAFLRQFTRENGYPPSVREICAAVGLKSTASVHYHLNELKRQGLIEMDENKNRSISLPVDRALQECVEMMRIPILGVVTAGLPILAVENVEGYLSWAGSDEDLFALRVRGESMMGAGILDGDLVVVRQQSSADNGDIVVALLEDEATVKRFRRCGNLVQLVPENPAFPVLDGRFASILGRVKAVVRTY